MTSRTCRSCFSRWTKTHKRENVCRERENIRERERERERIGKKEKRKKNKCKQIVERRQREVNEKQICRYGASASYVVHTLTLTDKNAVFRLALYPPLRPSAVRVRILRACMRVCIRVYVCVRVSRVYLYARDVR